METIYFEKNDGKIKTHGKSFSETVEGLPDGAYKITLDFLDTRNQRQNAFLWGIVYPETQKAWEHIGYKHTIDNIHFAFKHLFIKKKRKKDIITGRYKTEEPTTTNLSRKAFSEYIKNINEFCMDNMGYGLDIGRNDDLYFYDTIINEIR